MARMMMTRAILTAAAVAIVSPAAMAVDSKDNAALRYWRAWSMITEEGDETLAQSPWGYEPGEEFVTTPELVRFIEDQQMVIGLLREAAAMPGCDFGIDYDKGPHALMTHLRPVRTSVHLLTLDARLHANTGDLDTAVADLQAALRMERHISDGSMIIGALVATATFEATNRAIGQMLDAGQLDADARLALDDVLATFDASDPFGIKAGVAQERESMVAWFSGHLVAEDGDARRDLEALTEDVLSTVTPEQRELIRQFRSLEDFRAELEKYDTYYEHVLAIWGADGAEEKLQTLGEHAQNGGYGLFARLMAPTLDQVHANWRKSVETLADARERLAP